ncbi:MAG: TorF family putative porin [Vitreimonas sp.]
MWRILGVAIAGASVLIATPTFADSSFTGNVALTSDYVFRGISQTQGDPAIQGGFDFTTNVGGLPVYAGAWASNLDFGSRSAVHVPMELDIYGGLKPTIGPVSADFGVIGYLYPNADDPSSAGLSGDWNYWELKAAGSISPATGLTLGAAIYYSPEFPLKGGNALYTELNGSWAINDTFAVSGAVGHQQVDAAGYFVTPTSTTDNYTTWNVGATASAHGFSLDLRYWDSDEDITNFAGEVVSDQRVVLTFRRAL